MLRLLETLDRPVRTPRVRWEGPGVAYFGYEGIVGTLLSERMDRLDVATKTEIGRRIGQFLRELHGLQLEGAPAKTNEDQIANYRKKYELGRPALAEAFSAVELRTVESFIVEELPESLKRLGAELRLVHGDLGPWNIILSDAREIGIVDFGEIAYADVANDFAGFGDEAILSGAFEAYGADDLLREKSALRIKAFPILDIPFYLGKRDEAGVRACLELVRRVMIEGEAPSEDRYTRR